MSVLFKVAGIRMSSKAGDVKGNVEKGCRMIEEAVKEKVQLVCLPEIFNTGYFARAGRGETSACFGGVNLPLPRAPQFPAA